MIKRLIKFLAFGFIGLVAITANATSYICPTLKADELYYYFDWINSQGEPVGFSEWNRNHWRLWIHGDSYLTPKNYPVKTFALDVALSPSTQTWYLKCTSADMEVGPRMNVWPYKSCQINQDRSGFDCQS